MLLSDPTAGDFQKRLKERLEALKELNAVSKESRKPVALDQSKVGRLSRMDALQGQAMAAETARRRDIEVQRIEAALKRLETDDFGFCARCDEPISEKRLAHDPSVPLCINCARRKEGSAPDD